MILVAAALLTSLYNNAQAKISEVSFFCDATERTNSRWQGTNKFVGDIFSVQIPPGKDISEVSNEVIIAHSKARNGEVPSYQYEKRCYKSDSDAHTRIIHKEKVKAGWKTGVYSFRYGTDQADEKTNNPVKTQSDRLPRVSKAEDDELQAVNVKEAVQAKAQTDRIRAERAASRAAKAKFELEHKKYEADLTEYKVAKERHAAEVEEARLAREAWEQQTRSRK